MIKHSFLRYRPTIVAVVLTISLLLWFAGLFQSPFMHPHLLVEKQHTPDLQSVRALAEAYWIRYRDVRNHEYYGKNGKMGIYGAKEHYKTHGRLEGRIFGLLPVMESPLQEQQLAETYWQRYPDIEKSPVWGRRSSLGILGPRDHYHYLGRKQGRIWSPELPEKDD